MTEEIDYSDYILYIETLHGTTLKTLQEALKDLISDVNITFNTDTFGILKMNSNHSLLVHLIMFAEEFDKYYIQEPFIAGLNIPTLYKCLRTMNTNDVLRLVISRSDPNTLVVMISNAEKGQFNNFDIPLLDINEDDIEVPEWDFSFMVTMDPSDFQKIVRDMKTIGVEMIKVTYSKNCLQFEGHGEVKSHCSRQPGKHKLDIVSNDKNDANGIYQGIFELDKMVKFTKCTPGSEEVKLLLMNDYPMVFIYDVGCLGEIKLCLAPGTNPDEM